VSGEKCKGQYFTKSKLLKDVVSGFIKTSPEKVLEPSFGQGDLFEVFPDTAKTIVAYEIDLNLKSSAKYIRKPHTKYHIRYKNFLDARLRHSSFNCIAANPPYISANSTKNKTNIYIKFIEKCARLVKSSGEMIFIAPVEFFKLSTSRQVVTWMYNNGSFTDIFYPNKPDLFESANVDVMVFRWVRGQSANGVKVNVWYTKSPLEHPPDIRYAFLNNGVMTLASTRLNCSDVVAISKHFDLKMGMTSGKESVYRNDVHGNILVRVSDGDQGLAKYIFYDDCVTQDDIPKDVLDYLLQYKPSLLSRKIRKFSEKCWWKWGAARNAKYYRQSDSKTTLGIYVRVQSRNKSPAFVAPVTYTGNNLTLLVPKFSTSIENLKNIADYLNSSEFLMNYTASGKIVLGLNQIKHAVIPSVLIS